MYPVYFWYLILSDTSSGVDQDQVLEELLGKVKSNSAATKSTAHPFKTPSNAANHNISSYNSTTLNSTPVQNPFRKGTGIKRTTTKQVNILK